MVTRTASFGFEIGVTLEIFVCVGLISEDIFWDILKSYIPNFFVVGGGGGDI